MFLVAFTTGLVLGVIFYVRWLYRMRRLILEFEHQSHRRAVFLRKEVKSTTLAIVGLVVLVGVFWYAAIYDASQPFIKWQKW